MPRLPLLSSVLRIPSPDGPSNTTAVLPLLLVCLVWGVHPGFLHAQEPAPDSALYRVETVEGNVVIGTLISETGEEIVLNTRQLGEVTIERADIQSMEEIDPDRIRDGQYWFQNPQSSRYFFAPNAIGIPEGQGYYQNTWVLFNNVNYGVTDKFSVGAGTVPIFLFGANLFPVWVLPKVSISTPQKNFHLAAGAVLGGIYGDVGVDVNRGVGLVYGSATVGSRDHNATLGIGYGYAGGGFADTPLINVSGMTRIGRTTYLITENYYSPAWEGGVLSVGIRWAPENFAVDFALFRPLEEAGSFIGAPWLGVTIPFGQ